VFIFQVASAFFHFWIELASFGFDVLCPDISLLFIFIIEQYFPFSLRTGLMAQSE
jgi:hypothetical protein